MALTGRAGLLALAGVLVVLAAPSLLTLLLVDLVVGILLVVDVALAAPVRPLQLRRDGATRCRLGESASVVLTLANPGRTVLRATVRDAWSPSAGATPRRRTVVVPPGQQRLLESTLTPTRRGDRSPARVTVRSTGPLGLAARQGSHRVPWRLRVLPAFTSRKFLPERLSRLRQIEGATVSPVRGQGTEFDSLRDYVDGDDVRSIDWRATARRSEVVVRTWRPERDRRIVVVLDTGRTAAARVGDAPRLDASLDACLLLAALAARAGDRVDLLAHDRHLRAYVTGGTGASLLPRLVEAMAPLQASLVETDLQAVSHEVLTRVRARSLVVLFTALDPAPVEQGLLPALSALTARHTVMVAAVSDPAVAALARGRADAGEVYAAAAAESALAGRRAVTQQLRRRGVEVVEAPPERLAPAVADAYLALKAAGRL